MGNERVLAAGEALFRQGDATFGIFQVVAGRLRLVRHTSEGHEVLVHSAGVGETFAEAALFSPVYHCDAVAAEPSRVTVLAKEPLLRRFAADPAATLDFAARLARQLQRLRGRLELRNVRSATERVYQYLLLVERDGRVAFEQPMKEAAAEIGLTHEAFYRALAKLAGQGRVERDGRAVILRSPRPAR